jgi:hypothetical protein
MSQEHPSFAEFLRRIRAGDQQAAADLVRRYEPAIRLEVRRRLNDPSLYPVLESMDVCQSVLLSFLAGRGTGRFVGEPVGQNSSMTECATGAATHQALGEKSRGPPRRATLPSRIPFSGMVVPGLFLALRRLLRLPA